MRTLRQVNIKTCLHYFFNDMTNIKNFDPLVEYRSNII